MSNKDNVVSPLALLDKCISSKIWIILKGQKEFIGILKGFDE